jgi:transposase InsO family protein
MVLRRLLEPEQYASGEYRKLLTGAGMKASMSRIGNCYDKVPMESFFHTLKVELVRQQRRTTRDEARRDLFAYVEATTIGSGSIQPTGVSLPGRPSRRW